MTKLRKQVAKNIKAQRVKLGLTQEQLARKARVNVQYVSRLERVPQNLTLDIIEAVAKALEISPALLLTDLNKAPPGVDISAELKEAARTVIAVAEKLSHSK